MVQIINTGDEGAAISAAVQRLRDGEPVAIPTETVYGLAADATNGEAVAKIFEMKGRPSFNPLVCHVDGMTMATELGSCSHLFEQLAHAFWPGPLTLVVPLAAHSPVHDLVTAGLGSVGLRCPQGISRAIISALGRPLAAPSANRSGRISPTSAQHVADEFPDTGLMVVDDGPCPVGLESTILKIEGQRLVLLRPGTITADDIEAVTGIKPALAEASAGIQAPGMMTSHYAPDARVILDCEKPLPGSAWLDFGNRDGDNHPGLKMALNLSPSSDLRQAAANLYSYLKLLDASGAETICVAPIPMAGLGVAINDRLKRAAAPRTAD